MRKRREIHPGFSSPAHISPSNGRTSVSWRRGSRHAERQVEHLSIQHGKDGPPSPREVAWPIQDGQVRARPGPSVIKRPSCAVTSGAGASIIHDDPVSAPSEERARTLTGQPRVKPRAEFSMKDDRVIPSTYPGGCHLWAPARPPAKVRERVGAVTARTPHGRDLLFASSSPTLLLDSGGDGGADRTTARIHHSHRQVDSS
ncbi:hypothetical protein D4764_06G0002590 [Takifugu flavidus]|uniref:Uncharacterized protein n=1 Tax=Takifugu flavidus TaxID=433684 RepID=A0A5C6MVD3_9TELE|nr:hypothetical protein D4764_06G0002590 [Takifugu flavidus]